MPPIAKFFTCKTDTAIYQNELSETFTMEDSATVLYPYYDVTQSV